MKKKTELGELTWRKVNPRSRIPLDILEDFLKKDEKALEEGAKWIREHGLTILFTQKLAKGWEKVWVEKDGTIYICDEENLPSFKELERRCMLANVHDQYLKIGKDRKKLLLLLKEVEKPI